MRNSNAPPSYGQAPQGPPQGGPPMPSTMPQGGPPMGGQMGGPPMPSTMPQPQGGMRPWGQVPGMNWQQPGGGMPPPPAGAPPMAGGAPLSPEAYGEYRKLSAMPITGGKTRRLYNQAASQFANQYGTGFDPRGVFAKTKALRRQYGTKG